MTVEQLFMAVMENFEDDRKNREKYLLQTEKLQYKIKKLDWKVIDFQRWIVNVKIVQGSILFWERNVQYNQFIKL